MRRLLTLMACGIGLASCESTVAPIVLPPFGAAVVHNMTVQIVPTPPVFGLPPTTAARQQLAFERYRLGELPEAPPVATTTVVPAVE